jgi:hypothetical protein
MGATIRMRAVFQSFVDGKWTDIDTVQLTPRGSDKPFSSGKQGYYGGDKLMLPSVKDGSNNEERSHQVGINVTEIEPKSKD